MAGPDGEGRPDDGVLDILDTMASHALEARALAMMLPPDRADTLRLLCEGLLVEIARCVARELPTDARPRGGP